MAVMVRIRSVPVIALLYGIALIAGCTVAPVNQAPAPVVTGGQTVDMSEGLQPPAAAPSNRHAAGRSALHHRFAASFKSKRHASVAKKHRVHVKTAKQTAPHNATDQETAANAGVVHHLGPKIIPLE